MANLASDRFWVLRVYRGVRHSFPTRWLEWLMAIFIIVWGANFLGVVADTDPAVAVKSAWHSMTFWAPLPVWACLMITVGGLRLLALAINGTFADTIYSQYSPIVRAGGAFVGGIIWAFVALSALKAGTQSSITYPTIMIIEWFMAYFVFGEAGDNLRAHYGRSKRGR